MGRVPAWSDRTNELGCLNAMLKDPRSAASESAGTIFMCAGLSRHDEKMRGLATAHMPRKPASNTAQVPGSGIFGVSDNLTQV